MMLLHLLLFGCIFLACLQLCSFCEDVRQRAEGSSLEIPVRTIGLTLLLWLALYFLIPIDERRVNFFELLMLMSSVVPAMLAGVLVACFGVCLALCRMAMGAVSLVCPPK